MHFYYLDEAGCTGADLLNNEQPIFVLGGLSVRDEGWIKTYESYQNIIYNYFHQTIPADFELHAEQLLSPNGEGPFIDHDRERRNMLAINLINLLIKRKHDVHYFAIDKRKLLLENCDFTVCYNTKIPYHLAYDYIITYIDWIIKNNLGSTARGMVIVDVKEQFHSDIELITYSRRYNKIKSHRIKRIVEFSYPVDSRKNPMIQLSDLVVFCIKKFLEIENNYRNDYTNIAKNFYASCYKLIDSRIKRKIIIDRTDKTIKIINGYLKNIQSKPSLRWKSKYNIHGER